MRGQFIGYRKEKGVDPESDTETFVALKCQIDNWRWAGVPFYLRTGKRMAEGQRIISIAFREPPRSMFPEDSGISSQGPDHLTFDLADQSKVSLSFYGKKPGPGMRLSKQSLQFALHETGLAGDVLEAYERLILDAMRGDHTLFCTADGIERLWQVSTRLLDNPPPVRMLRAGQLGAAVDLSTDRAACLAAAVRARLARPQSARGLKPFPRVCPACYSPAGMTDLPLVLEPETADDAEAIQHLNERVFGPGRFARSAYRIREQADPDPRLSFVARVGTLMVGAVAMTPIVIGTAPALLLGPLIVEPVFRSQGIGEALVVRSLEAAKAAGADARHSGRRRALLRAYGISARSPPAVSRCQARSIPLVSSIANSRPGPSQQPRARRAAPDSATNIYRAARKYVCQAPFCRIVDFAKDDLL